MVRNCHFCVLFPISADFFFFLRSAQTGKSEIDILDVQDMETIFVINAKL